MLESDRLVQELLNVAPNSLKRESDTILHEPDLSRVIALNGYSQLSENITKRLANVANAIKSGHATVAHVTAKDSLSIALKVPKRVWDHDADWFGQTPRELANQVSTHRFGRYATFEEVDICSKATRFNHAAQTWRSEVASASDRGQLYEFGILAQKDDDHTQAIASVSVPWYPSTIPWQMHLTEPRIFVGREDLLEQLSLLLSGKSLSQVRTEHLFNASEADVWWGQTQALKKIVRGPTDDVIIKTRPDFAQRITSKVSTKLQGKKPHDTIRHADWITGYFVTAKPGPFPGTVDLLTHVDTVNWAKSSDNPYQKELGPEPLYWSYGGDGLHLSTDLALEAQKATSVYIKLADLANRVPYEDGSTGVQSLEITRSLRLKPGSPERQTYYALNLPNQTDCWTHNSYLPEDVHPLEPRQLIQLADWFSQARKLTPVDGPNFYSQPRRMSLTPRTQTILHNTRCLLSDKMLQAGIDQATIDSHLSR